MSEYPTCPDGAIRVLFVGDVVADPGLSILQQKLPALMQRLSPTFVVVNGENSCNGKGIRPSDAATIFGAGADVITSGNHVWDKWQSKKVLTENRNVLRPANYPPGAAGSGAFVVERGEDRLAVWNLQGLTFMPDIDCPFRAAKQMIRDLEEEIAIVVDFHAEATAEKIAFGRFLDGRVSAVVGTHTHVPTSDEQILPRGTAYLTDLGMTGAYSSVIGMAIEPAVNRFLYKTPFKYEPGVGDERLCGAVVDIDRRSLRAVSIFRVAVPAFRTTA